ncbi:MAG: hypothetical protein FWF91_00710 [Coriobacteriia bacterium]|nr:hypothetical protein [Coriobacteriia bacterium]
MERRRRKISSLDQEMRAYLKSNDRKESLQTLDLQGAWEKVATEEALRHTDNIVFSKRKNRPATLVYVDNNHWAAQLEIQKELYQYLMEHEMKAKIPELCFLVSQKASYKKEFRKRREEERVFQTQERSVALTEEEERGVRETVAGIKDEELKERLYKAMKKDLEWKKGLEGLKTAENAPESPETI